MDVGEFIVVVAGGAFTVGRFVGRFFLKEIIVVVTFWGFSVVIVGGFIVADLLALGGFIIGGFIVTVASYGFAADGLLIGTFFVVEAFIIAIMSGVSILGEVHGISSLGGSL